MGRWMALEAGPVEREKAWLGSSLLTKRKEKKTEIKKEKKEGVRGRNWTRR